MTRNFHMWEVDPFFSAAEEVQDSADRLESVYRTWIHAKSLEIDTYDSTSIEFYRRELSTALGTAKWQLEEFEKAVSCLDTDNQRHAGDDASGRHKQFIVALRNQISSIEMSLLSSKDSRDLKALPIVKLRQEEKDDLALFLCGSRMDMDYDVKKPEFCADSTLSNGKIDEGVPCTTSESVKSKSDCFSTSASNSDVPLSRMDFQSSDICDRVHDLSSSSRQSKNGHKHGGSLDFSVEDGRKSFQKPCFGAVATHQSSEIVIEEYRSLSVGSGLDVWKTGSVKDGRNTGPKKVLRIDSLSSSNFWSPFSKKMNALNARMSKSGLKRWKDGDANSKDRTLLLKLVHEGDLEKGTQCSWLVEHSNHRTMLVLAEGLKSCAKGSQVLLHAFSSNRPVQRASAFLVALGVLGLLVFHVTP